jgi:hypothetical protein
LSRPTISTNSRTWKKAKTRVAALVGARRQIHSGSPARDDASRSEILHPRISIEAKYRQGHAVRSLFVDTNAKDRKEDKTPFVAMIDKGQPECSSTHLFITWPNLGEFARCAA